eukprot:SAG31_NODE_27459_length_425_cov_2.601227_2_plen_52_part_01
MNIFVTSTAGCDDGSAKAALAVPFWTGDMNDDMPEPVGDAVALPCSMRCTTG